MRVILKEDVAHVGNMGDIVKVADGYGRNYLIPQGLAELATEDRAKAFAHQKAMIEHKKAKLHNEALELQAKVNGLEVKLVRAAVKDETRIHGSVTNRDIAEELAKLGVEIDKRKIDLAQPIRELGEHNVEIKLVHDVIATVKVTVIAE
ncbi:MAG: 50S ribosomal protein L9 [Proteobacteria bacterium]|nr:50S ribosomal protein L9 [Pseudomonadota bacterium]MBQ4360748.1 50S ribosomal protein L9 [Pseudomonadota bacterium]